MHPSVLLRYDESIKEEEEQSNQPDEHHNEDQENNDKESDDEDGENDDEEDWSNSELSALNLLIHMCCKFPRPFRTAAEHHSIDILKQPLDSIATFAMWSDANVNIKQARIIARHLRLWFNNPVVSSDAKWKLALNNSPRKFVHPICGEYQQNNEKIEWSYRNPVKVVLYFFNGLFNRKNHVNNGRQLIR